MIIGIDPDLDKNGVALVEGDKIVSLHGLRFVELLRLMDQYPDATYVLEDVEANKPTFNRGITNRKQENKISQNVGQVKGVARIIGQCLEDKDCRFIKAAPLKGIHKKAKNDKAFFNQLTGWEGQSNQDKRDAALLAKYGIRPGQYVPRPSEVPH